MNATDTQTSNSGFMPRNVAIALLTSNQSKTNGFRKRLFRAMEKVCEPLSRSTALPVSAPKIGAQRLQARLVKASAAQLHRWHKRTLRRGERYQDRLFETQAKLMNVKPEDVPALERVERLLTQQIQAHDGLCEAIANELTNRSARGKGYQERFRYRKI